jgi:hypothetical protein
MATKGPSLADLGAQCLKFMSDLLSKVATVPSFPIVLSDLEIQIQRFQLWANNLNLFHEAHGSLDYRLRDAPSIQSLVQKLLQELLQCLNHRMSIHVNCWL